MPPKEEGGRRRNVAAKAGDWRWRLSQTSSSKKVLRQFFDSEELMWLRWWACNPMFLDCLNHRFQHVTLVVSVDEGLVIGNTVAVAVAVNVVVGSVRAILRPCNAVRVDSMQEQEAATGLSNSRAYDEILRSRDDQILRHMMDNNSIAR